tara:strand:- start:1446 stop:1574 length:129 start_codon:yes stop_codon:yes gene_type:complete
MKIISEKKLRKVIGGLKKAVKLHGQQADSLTSVLKENKKKKK